MLGKNFSISLRKEEGEVWIRIIYLISGTQGVVTQSPEPGAHEASV